jgi:hypothetical protein
MDQQKRIEDPDAVKDVDVEEMQEKEILLWKVCVLCSEYMRQ